MVAVLAGNRHGAGHALRRERGDGAAGGAVVGGTHCVDLVVILGEDLLHVFLGVGRQAIRRYTLRDIPGLSGINGALSTSI